ncbi:MAG: Outer membrane protein assembly factor BamB [Phycisphaerae bacterium]|nr:Outer membrane protein assembly factor BamB [Phycisphaerae bacterium]
MKLRGLLCAVVSILAPGAIGCLGPAQPAGTTWPMWGADAGHTFHVAGMDLARAPAKAWEVKLEDLSNCCGMAADERSAYVLYNRTGKTGSNGELACLNLDDGSQRWAVTLDWASPTMPCSPMLADDSVYVMTDRSLLRIAAGDGRVIWTKDVSQFEDKGWVQQVGRRLVLGSDGNRLVCFNLDSGSIEWDAAGKKDEEYYSLFLGAEDGTMVSGGGAEGNQARAFDLSNGREAWSYTAPIRKDSSLVFMGGPTVAAGRAVVTSLDHANEKYFCTVHCLDLRTGWLCWKNRMPALALTGFGMACDGRRLVMPVILLSPPKGQDSVTLTDSKVCVECVDLASGWRLWRSEAFAVKADAEEGIELPLASLPILVDGVVLLRLADGRLAGLDAQSGSKLWETPGPPPSGLFQDHTIVSGGRIILTAGDRIVALAPSAKQ